MFVLIFLFQDHSLYAATGTTDYQCTPAQPALQSNPVAVFCLASSASRPDLRILPMRALRTELI
jgi:hypothetical protein